MMGFLRNPSPQANWMTIEATSTAERIAWGKPELDTRNPGDSQLFRSLVQQNRRRNKQESTVLYFESNRSIARIDSFQPSWDYTDPWLEMMGWDFGFNSLAGRFNDTVHSIFRKVRSRRDEIARYVEQEISDKKDKDPASKPTQTQSSLVQVDPSKFPDPIEPFKRAFSQLLAPKVLEDPDPRQHTLFYRDGGETRAIDALSSGEREVLNIVFDFLLRGPTDCIVIFDEPELHLHPELSFKLLQTLKQSGSNNQFIFCTHSPDIITAALDNSVVFIAPPKIGVANQAISVREGDETHQALRLIGQSIGIVALGKKLVLIEGDPSSVKQRLKDIASTYKSYAAALSVASHFRERVGNLDIMPKGVHVQDLTTLTSSLLSKASEEHARIGAIIAPAEINTITAGCISEIETSFVADPSSSDPLSKTGDRWKALIPGRPIMQVFCGSAHAKLDVGRFKTAYLKAAERLAKNPFQEVNDIFASFEK
jgi:hypothetical protein